MFAGAKTLGISLIVMVIISFIGVLTIGDVFFLSTISLAITYTLNGYLSATFEQNTPYFVAYMTSWVLVTINLLFSWIALGINLFFNADVVFNSFLTGTLLYILGACIKRFIDKRGVGEHA
jgi:hypothetical protein